MLPRISKGLDNKVMVMDILMYGRLLKLFDLLDENKDGGVSREELATGLKTFHAAMGIESDEELLAALLMFERRHEQGRLCVDHGDLRLRQ